MPRIGCIALAAACLGSSPARSQGLDPRIHRQIRQAAQDYMRAGHIPGMSLAVSLGGRIVLEEAFGYADLENQVLVDTLTAFPTASVVKVITATAVLQLAERHLMDLDWPVEAYCPGFPAKRWPVTPRRLLTHQAGIRPSNGAAVFNRRHFSTVKDALTLFAGDSLLFEPGTGTVYSNEGYVLLACAIEGASGRSYDDYLKERILGPTGMNRTFPDNVYRVMPGIARSYLVRTEQNTQAWKGLWTPAQLTETSIDVPAVAEQVDLSLFPGAGNYRSTPGDMLRFVLALERQALLGDSLT